MLFYQTVIERAERNNGRSEQLIAKLGQLKILLEATDDDCRRSATKSSRLSSLMTTPSLFKEIDRVIRGGHLSAFLYGF